MFYHHVKQSYYSRTIIGRRIVDFQIRKAELSMYLVCTSMLSRGPVIIATRRDFSVRRASSRLFVQSRRRATYRIPMMTLLLTAPRKLMLTSTSPLLSNSSGSLITTCVNQSNPGTLPPYSTFAGYIFPAAST